MTRRDKAIKRCLWFKIKSNVDEKSKHKNKKQKKMGKKKEGKKKTQQTESPNFMSLEMSDFRQKNKIVESLLIFNNQRRLNLDKDFQFV